MNATLTKTEQVLAVLKAGGKIRQRSGGIRVLRDSNNFEVPAWQNAMKAAERIHRDAAESKRDQKRAGKLASEAEGMIVTALNDLRAGDRLDAIDMLEMAINRLRDSRAASFPNLTEVQS